MTRNGEPDLKALATRVDTLEVRIAYQDQVIEQLNQTIIAQWAALDHARALIERLDGRLRDGQDNTGGDTFNNQPPPHW